MTFALGNPGAFHCLMDWDATGSRSATFLITNDRGRAWVGIDFDSQPVIVMRPAPGGWAPLQNDRGQSVLPPGHQCYMFLPDSAIIAGTRMHTIRARGYLPSQFSPDYGMVLLEHSIDEFPVPGDSTTHGLSRIKLNMSGSHSVVGSISLPDRKSTRLNSSHIQKSRMPSSA